MYTNIDYFYFICVLTEKNAHQGATVSLVTIQQGRINVLKRANVLVCIIKKNTARVKFVRIIVTTGKSNDSRWS